MLASILWAALKVRGVPHSALAAALLCAAWMVLPHVVDVPSFRGGEAQVPAKLLLAAVLGITFLPLPHSTAAEYESRATRDLRGLRLTIASIVIAFLGVLCAASLAVGDQDTVDWVPMARNVALSLGWVLLLSRTLSAATTIASYACFVSVCLFAGIQDTGQPEWWALPLHQTGSGLDLTLSGAVLVLGVGRLMLQSPAVPRPDG